MYKDSRWRSKREVILKRDAYICRECSRYGKTQAAEQVHHINPVEIYPELALVNDNLVSLCTGCHDKMHNRNDRTLTAAGMIWVNRIKDRIRERFPEYNPPGSN